MGTDDSGVSRPSSYDAILKAAVAEYAEHGRDGVRMEQVAKRAGVNKSLVYRHFEDRDGLFEAALGVVFAERFKLLEALPDDLSELFDLWTSRFAGNPLFTRMILREALEQASDEPLHANLRRDYYAHQVESIRGFQARGLLPSDADPQCLFLMLTAVLAFPFLLPQVTMLVTGKSPESRAFARRWKGLFESLLANLREEDAG